ncbi:unnamed protein product [Effrenium voratum]|nr:unnamed protein product [Effrenium voratum]
MAPLDDAFERIGNSGDGSHALSVFHGAESAGAPRTHGRSPAMSGYWEAGWSREQQRYYYMDKDRLHPMGLGPCAWQRLGASGKSQWSRPPGCELDLPTVPPKEGLRAKSPPPPTDLPPGWKAELDITPQVNRYFYYREAKPDMRTWYKPLHPSEDDEQEAHQEEQDEAEKVKALTKRLYMFARPIQQLKAQRDEAKKKKLANELIQDVFRANSDFIAKSDHITVPVSKQVEYNASWIAVSASAAFWG